MALALMCRGSRTPSVGGMTTTTAPQTAVRADPLLQVAAWIAPLGPLAMAGWSLAIPYDLVDSPAEFIPKMADVTRVQLSFWMMLIFVLTIGVGVIVTGLLARRGSPRLGTIGLVTAYLGFTAMGFGGITYDALSAIPLSAGVDIATIQAVLAQADGFTAPTVGGMLFAPLSFLGTLLLGTALWRSRAIPRWAAGLMLVAFPVILAGGMFLMALNALGFVMLAVAFAVAARRLVNDTRDPGGPRGRQSAHHLTSIR